MRESSQKQIEESLSKAKEHLERAYRQLHETPAFKMVKLYEEEIAYWESLKEEMDA